jgi:cell division protein FtsB
MGFRSTPASSGSPTQRLGRRVLHYVLVLVSAIVITDALVGEKGFLAMVKARKQFRQLEESLVRAREENARMREEARRLREDPAAIEEIARRELGLIKPGEKLFIVKDTQRTPR